MSFAQIYRAFRGAQQRQEERAVLTREIAYLIYASNTKGYPTPKNIWWPIGEVQDKGVTAEDTAEVYRKYGKLKRNGRKRNAGKDHG